MSTLTAYALSEHAQKRRKEMHVTEAEIGRTISDPHCVYPSPPSHPGNDVRKIYQRDRICVVVDEHKHLVITVLWHRKEGRS